ncbi:hypothetical protein [Nocardiopsis suaedae]|uniref:Uncharacterized protein n=1 Tax=Nocardiopsis suaedae TaxID=3018444 RepID=A0ABT4TGH0_9ACTN|nr:hypothetical protein [Nocardiopsis suaedae]MDA2803815.1 hypothetical protein [Nocardiopsis suaedae]
MADDFGDDHGERKRFAVHVTQASNTFSRCGSELKRNPEGGAVEIGRLAYSAMNNVANNRFGEVLPAALIAADPSMSPDRADGRQLVKARCWGFAVTALILFLLAKIGVAAEVNVFVAAIFPLVVYLVLAYQYGLNGANRIMRNIISMFTPG